MSDPANHDRHAEKATVTDPPGGRARRRWSWVMPVALFVVGLLLGGTVVGLARGSDEETGAATHRTPAPTVTTPAPEISGRVVVIPRSCEQAVSRAQEAVSTVQQAADALRAVDTARLGRLIDQLQTAQQEVERLAQQCKDAAATEASG
jgi:hypothetical protein